MSINFTSHFSADDAALVLIDFQRQMFMGVESHDRNARYPTCTRNDGRSHCLRSGLLTAVSVNRDEGRP
jgi:hypothetical protein